MTYLISINKYPLIDNSEYFQGHCVVQIQREKSLLIGGMPNSNNYLYNWITKVRADSYGKIDTTKNAR